MVIHMTRQQLYTRGGILDELMDTGFSAAGLVDAAGRLIRYSVPTLRDLGKTQEECVGRPIEELDPDTHLGQVARTGVPEAGRLVLMRGKYHIVTELPIYEGTDRIGGMGMLVSLDTNKLKRALGKLSEGSTQSAALYDSLARASGSYTFNDFIGEHPLVRELLDRCRQAASTRYPVLITGETGTGKEILAGAIHSTAFPSGSAPYVKINCTAIPDNLLESELFGHEKGAFTGAVTAKKGKFELAGGGSILLDEIGEMDLRMQSKLLRVLEEKEFERLGGSRMQVMDTRVMASTNADLHALADAGRFRSDLYYRLSTIEISVPPLRERASDIPGWWITSSSGKDWRCASPRRPWTNFWPTAGRATCGSCATWCSGWASARRARPWEPNRCTLPCPSSLPLPRQRNRSWSLCPLNGGRTPAPLWRQRKYGPSKRRWPLADIIKAWLPGVWVWAGPPCTGR